MYFGIYAIFETLRFHREVQQCLLSVVGYVMIL